MSTVAKAAKQQVFLWEGKDRAGMLQKGELSAVNSALAKAELRRKQIKPLKVRKKPATLFAKSKSIKAVDIAVFTRQVATMLGAGIPLIQTFQILIEGFGEHPSMRALIQSLKVDVEDGTTFAASLRKHPGYFDRLYCNLVETGEQSGSLDTMLARIATYKEKTEALKGKIKKALFYPAAVTVVAFIVCSILLIFAVPQFEEIFTSNGAELPVFTQFVMKVSDIFVAFWYIIIPAFIATPFLLMMAKKRSKKFANIIDRMVLKFPVFGPIVHKAIIARYARTLSTTFSAGVPLVEALDSVAGATGNIVYEKAVYTIKDAVTTGQKMFQVMKYSGLFPMMVVQMVSIGEESGTLDEMLNKVANIYEEEVDNAVEGLSSLIEPFIIAFLGVFVGGLVIAMYLPIFKMGGVM